VFGNVSPFDPQLFARINDFADELLKGESNGKYSPIEVAQWLEDYASQAAKSLAKAETLVALKQRPEYRRMATDISIQIGLGKFFSAKFRSAVLYRIYERTGDRTALNACLDSYRRARTAWAELATLAKGVYVPDITVGEHPQLRGHWMDRLPAIDADIALIASRLDQSHTGNAPESAIRAALERPVRPSLPCRHQPVARLQPGNPLELELLVEAGAKPVSARVYYRHVTQAERYESAEMQFQDGRYRASVPAGYTGSLYPIEYYFELKQGPASAWLYPGLGPDLTSQPYFVVSHAG
jgi:hypothetical protein